MTELELAELSADLSCFGKGRVLDDNAQIMLRYANGGRRALRVSQVPSGEENELRLRIYGTKGGVNGPQSNPNRMIWTASQRASSPWRPRLSEKPNERRLYAHVQTALGAPHNPRATIVDREQKVNRAGFAGGSNY